MQKFIILTTKHTGRTVLVHTDKIVLVEDRATTTNVNIQGLLVTKEVDESASDIYDKIYPKPSHPMID